MIAIYQTNELIDFKVRIAKARRKYMVGAMEYRKRQLENKHKIKEMTNVEIGQKCRTQRNF